MSERDDVESIARLHQAFQQVRDEIGRVIVGQTEAVEQMLYALLARGHCLLVGAPGLAKTLMIRTLASALSLDFSRIQFTPDLMPADITGAELIEDDANGRRAFRFLPGPIFANMVLADEVNRTPPKTQAALLEAMQERQVTAGGRKHALPAPFFVLATQNPIEQEGTYPLPEAQLDRFMFQIRLNYPSESEELEIVRRTTIDAEPTPATVLSGEDLSRFAGLVRRVPVADHIALAALRMARLSRPGEPDGCDMATRYVQWGAGPRASQQLVLGAKARAALHGRLMVTWADIRAVAFPVLRHRIKRNFAAQADGVRQDEIVQGLIDAVEKQTEALETGGSQVSAFRSAGAG